MLTASLVASVAFFTASTAFDLVFFPSEIASPITFADLTLSECEVICSISPGPGVPIRPAIPSASFIALSALGASIVGIVSPLPTNSSGFTITFPLLAPDFTLCCLFAFLPLYARYDMPAIPAAPPKEPSPESRRSTFATAFMIVDIASKTLLITGRATTKASFVALPILKKASTIPFSLSPNCL